MPRFALVFTVLWYAGRGSQTLIPPPDPLHETSLVTVPVLPRVSVVPPTASTAGLYAGEVSVAQPPSTGGRAVVLPVWLTFLNVGGAGSANVVSNFARSAAIVGSSYAETIAIVWPVPVPVRPR